MSDIETKMNTKIPRCLNEWCTSNLPATRSIEIRPGSTDYYAVCDNCYYDYVYEGIRVYSWNDNKRRWTKEEELNLRSKLHRYGWK